MIHKIWVSVLFLFLLLFIGIAHLDSAQKETMRTIYVEPVHPIVEYIKPNYYGGSYSTQTMNEWVDHYISSYFDGENVPYLNTIDMYRQYVVNKGVLKQDYKNKMRDMCHYIINIVIPNMPTVENPDPKVYWPKVEWLSDDWTPYNYSFNLDAMANLFGGKTTYKRTAAQAAATKKEKESKNNNQSTNASTRPDKTAAPSSTAAAPSVDSGSSGDCKSCPTDCFNKLLKTIPTQGPSTPGPKAIRGISSPGSESSSSNSIYSSSTGQEHSESSDSSLGTAYVTVNQVIVTKEPVTNISSQELNEWVFNKMNSYVDLEFDLYPTKEAQRKFIDFVKIYGPIDRAHKNKLRDLIYYFMENIIPGLPTDKKPVCYVEWRPIRWLSNSNL